MNKHCLGQNGKPIPSNIGEASRKKILAERAKRGIKSEDGSSMICLPCDNAVADDVTDAEGYLFHLVEFVDRVHGQLERYLVLRTAEQAEEFCRIGRHRKNQRSSTARRRGGEATRQDTKRCTSRAHQREEEDNEGARHLPKRGGRHAVGTA